jgi:hypothetical protein
MKKFAASVLTSLALIAGAPAFAQSAPAVDPAALAAAHDMFDAMNYRTLMGGMMRQMGQGIGASMLATTPKLMGEGMQIGQQVFLRRVGPLMQKMETPKP